VIYTVIGQIFRHLHRIANHTHYHHHQERTLLSSLFRQDRISSSLRILFIAACMQVCAISQAALPAGVQAVTTIEGVSEYRLNNGLRILLLPDDSKPLITANLVYLVGSKNEGSGEGGMAHLLEHMLFKGTPATRDPKAEFTKRGMQWNGTTDVDRTQYYATFNAEGDNLNWYLGWLADAMVNSFIARRDLDSEMTVVRNEFERGETNFTGVLLRQMTAAAYQWHPYGKPTIGSRTDIEHVSIDSLQRFYRKYYQPDDAVLVVSGKIDVDATLARIASGFGKIPKPTRKLELIYTLEPVQEGNRSVTVQRVGGVPVVAVAYHSVAGGSREAVTQAILLSILNEEPAGRLHKALVETGLATSEFAYSKDTQDPGGLVFGIVKAQQVLIDTLEAMPSVTEEEVTRAKTAILNATNRGMLNANQFAMSLTDEIALGDWRLAFAQRDWINDVTVADVNKLAHAYLLESNRTLGRYLPTDAPQRAPVTTRADTEKLLADYHGKQAVAAVHTFDMTNTEIEKRTIKTTLPGGMKIATLMRPTKGDRVTGSLSLHWGTLAQLIGKRGDTTLISSMLMKGTTRLSRQALEDRLNQLDATLSASAGMTGANLSFGVPKANLPQLVDLMHDVLRHPVFPQTEFDEAQRATITNYQAALSNPGALASNALRQHMSPYLEDDPRFVQSLAQMIDEVNAAKLARTQAFYERYANAADSELAVVGPVDANEVAKMFKNAFDDWTGKQPYARINHAFQDIAGTRIVINTPGQASATYYAQQPVDINDDAADMPALYIAVHALGGDSNSRLWKRVREKDGLSYGVSSSLTSGVVDKNGAIGIGGTLAPQNRDKFETAVKEELARALKDGFSTEEIAAAKDSILKSRRQSITQEATVGNILSSNLFWGKTFLTRENFDRRYAQVTAEEANAALRKYLKLEKLTVVAAGDFEKK
jgi:zinc protease